MEHSDGAGGIAADHFMVDTPEGYVIHPFLMNDNGTRVDRGLYGNAVEFVEQIETRLARIGIA